MMVQQIDRKQLKRDSRALLRTAQVAPMAMTALYLGLVLVPYRRGDSDTEGFFINTMTSSMMRE